MTRRFQTLDVFTETALAGNPLAVVLDADGLDDARMQAIAAEFNLSETVFVFEPRDAINSARVRIFTPKRELPFAGHPTVGTAALIAHLRAGDLLVRQDLRIVLEETIGDVVCVARQRKGQALAAYFELPKLPETACRPSRLPRPKSPQAWGSSRRTSASTDMSRASSAPALPFCSFPSARSRRSAAPRPARCPGRPRTARRRFVYTRETAREGSAYHARMFAGAWGVGEDPATGSAAAAFAGVVQAFDRPQRRRAHADHRARLRDGPAEPHRARARDRGRRHRLRHDRRLGRPRRQWLARPLSEPFRLLEVGELDLAFEPSRWAFAERRADSIAAHWARLRQAKPMLFNGRVLLLGRRMIETRPDGVFKLERRLFRDRLRRLPCLGRIRRPRGAGQQLLLDGRDPRRRRRVPARRDGAAHG